MKLWVIGSQDAVWGFALAGVGGQIVATAEELNQALDAALKDEDVGIILRVTPRISPDGLVVMEIDAIKIAPSP